MTHARLISVEFAVTRPFLGALLLGVVLEEISRLEAKHGRLYVRLDGLNEKHHLQQITNAVREWGCTEYSRAHASPRGKGICIAHCEKEF